MTVADYMAAANAHYYATRDPLGAAGDFTTAPEISQMFGEMIGIWIADLWRRAGSPAIRYVEIGPGRGTLAADALRTLARFGCAPQGVHLVEASPVLRAAQAARLPSAEHHDAVDALPDDLPLVVVANEFFDALPIHQYVRTADGWRERMVERRDGRLVAVPGDTPVDEIIPRRCACAARARSSRPLRRRRRSCTSAAPASRGRAVRCWPSTMATAARRRATRCKR